MVDNTDFNWLSSIQVVNQTIARDLDDINAKVKQASYDLRSERVKLIKVKVKEVLGKDVDIAIGELNTDVLVNLNLNDLAKTEGIVSCTVVFESHFQKCLFSKISNQFWCKNLRIARFSMQKRKLQPCNIFSFHSL